MWNPFVVPIWDYVCCLVLLLLAIASCPFKRWCIYIFYVNNVRFFYTFFVWSGRKMWSIGLGEIPHLIYFPNTNSPTYQEPFNFQIKYFPFNSFENHQWLVTGWRILPCIKYYLKLAEVSLPFMMSAFASTLKRQIQGVH